MDVKYETLEEIVSALSVALEIAENAWFEFEYEGQQDEHEEQLEEIRKTYRKTVNLL